MINGINIGILLFLIGLYGIITNKNLIKIIMSLGLASNGIILFFISIGYVKGGLPPILTTTAINTNIVDPVPQALMLTMIVINLCDTALALAIVMWIYKKFGTVNIEEIP